MPQFQVLYDLATGDIDSGGYSAFFLGPNRATLNFEGDMPHDLDTAWRVDDGRLVRRDTPVPRASERARQARQQLDRAEYAALRGLEERVEFLARRAGLVE